MEFLDEDTRPRFLFQSKASTSPETESQPHQKPNKAIVFITVLISCLLLTFSIFFLQLEPFRSLLVWISISLLIGPFAPIALTGGDIRVGHGPIVEFPDKETTIDDETKKKASQKRSKVRRSEEIAVWPVAVIENVNASEREQKKIQAFGGDGNGVVTEEEKEWNDEDIEILRKQLLKHPVGKPRRWEVITEAFRGRHKMESVIKKAKELGEKKVDDGDSYAQFLKRRKPMDKRVEKGNENLGDEKAAAESRKDVNGGEGVTAGWNSGEDIALLNALKAFPKDVAMRWEKIAAAVPGKSKAACMKRVTELKKEFRSAKAATDG